MSQMKEGRRAGGITAGPESKVLDGATWEERADSVAKTMAGEGHVDYKVGAASKGIIQRDYQHHATVYKSVYAKNPFDNVSSQELEEYQRIVDMKSRGEGAVTLSYPSASHYLTIFRQSVCRSPDAVARPRRRHRRGDGRRRCGSRSRFLCLGRRPDGNVSRHVSHH